MRSLDYTLVNTFLEHVPDAVFFKDRDSRVIATSKSNAIKLGFVRSEELIGKTDFDIFSKEHAQRAFDDEQRIIHTGEPVIDKLEKEVWPDGHVTWTVTSKMPLRDGQGAIIGTFGITRDVTQTKELEFALEKTRRELMDASRQAGMAEVATGVLHNVGNAVNSLNVSANVIRDGLRHMKLEHLGRLCSLLREHATNLESFLATDPKGRRVPEFLESLNSYLTGERARLIGEVDGLMKHVEHVVEIVAMQQAYATMMGVIEAMPPEALMEDALRMNAGALARHDVRVVREFGSVPLVIAERGKVLQILVNLIRNAKYACDERGGSDKQITLRTEHSPDGRVRLIVSDNGIGIAAENLVRIFNHGFTTRKGGHGFGLHSSALAAKEMKGTLTVQSDGPGRGATFMLELSVADTGAVQAN